MGDSGGGGSSTSTLTPDQQKIADATAKIAATQPPSGKPVMVKPIMAMKAPAALLEKDFGIDADSPEDLRGEESGDTKVVVVDDKKITPEQKVGDDKIIELPKKEEVKSKGEDKKEPEKKLDKKVEDSKEKSGLIAPVKKGEPSKAAPRDYSEFAPEEVAVLKEMSNPAFEFTQKSLRELKALRTQQKPDGYLQHPQGYMLSPEYNAEMQKAQSAEFEAGHWKAQLLNVRQGKPWTPLMGYDNSGKPVYGNQVKPTDEAEIDITNVMNYAMQVAGESKGRISALQQGFKQRVDSDMQNIQQERAKRFAWVADPKQLEEKVDVGNGIGEVPIKQLIGDFRGLFGAHHQSNPLLDVAADLFVALQIYGQRLRAAESETRVEKKLKEDIVTAEPNLEGGGDGKGVKEELVFDTADMP